MSRTPASIQQRREKVREMHGSMALCEIVKALGVSKSVIDSDCKEMGLRKLPPARLVAPTPSAARPPEPRKVRPMTAKELEAHERLRVRYTPETLPWQAYRMTGPVYVPPPDNTRWGR